MWAKGFVWGLALASLAWVALITALDLWLLSRLPALPAAKALETAVAVVCLIPFTLAGWAVPLGVSYRLLYDGLVPAGLPTWRKGCQVGLVADYGSVFWRGYKALCIWSGLLIPVHLVLSGWCVLALVLTVLGGIALRAGVGQWRHNARDQVIIDGQRRTLSVPPLGEMAWSEADFGVETELVVSPRSDTTNYWVTVGPRRWKRFALLEQAEQVVSWLREETSSPTDRQVQVAQNAQHDRLAVQKS